MAIQVSQRAAQAAERFNCDMRCGMSGTQVHGLAGLLDQFAEHGVRYEAQFLIDRIGELEFIDGEQGYRELQRDFFGHVEPAVERLKMAMRSVAHD